MTNKARWENCKKCGRKIEIFDYDGYCNECIRKFKFKNMEK